ncbi:MAG: hypothetical protein HQL12_04810 [Candidatus Omnitrophica bacterium]|nr:hypothetical protein [Candidatus Omnitrophota bacterium]
MHPKLTWKRIYSEKELYRAAIRLYTPPLFNWRKALGCSTDKKNLYDFARHGLANIERINEDLNSLNFQFRHGKAFEFNFSGKERTIYIFPWEERLVDVLLYRLLNFHLNSWFSNHSYAYRLNGLGINACQKKIITTLNSVSKPLFIIKRDLADYFNSIDQNLLLKKLDNLIDTEDFLYSLLKQRINFSYERDGQFIQATRGIPFGTAIACFFANVYLTALDRLLERIPRLQYFRYSDDILMFSSDRSTIFEAMRIYNNYISEHGLVDKKRHQQDLFFNQERVSCEGFKGVDKFKHLGLEFRANGVIGLSRDKTRKICNIFRYALRKKRKNLAYINDETKRINLVINTIQNALDEGLCNIAIIDYYLQHIDDGNQLKLLDRWLAEEALAVIFSNGHKKGNFKRLSFAKLRELGLPSLTHRRRLIKHKHLNGVFFRWQEYKTATAYKGTAARPLISVKTDDQRVFSSFPKAAAEITL